MANYGSGNQNYGDDSGDSRQVEAMRKLFIGGLLRETADDSFTDYFSQFGTLVDSVVIKDPNTGGSRGFGFVTYDHSDSVENLFQNRPHVLDGKTLDCKRAMPREFKSPTTHTKTTRLFVGGFKGLDLEPEELRQYLESRHPTTFGTLEKIDFLKDKETGTNKGFGFIDCSDTDFADRLAISENQFELKGRKMSIKKAEPKDGGSGDQIGGRGGYQSGGRGRGSSRGGGRGGRGSSRGGRGSRGGYQNSGNQSNDGYNSQGYGNNQGYGSQSNQGGYGNQSSYGSQNSYSNQGNYNNQGSYSNQSSYGTQGSYGNSQGSYGGYQNQQQSYGGNSSYGGGYQQSDNSGGYNNQSYGGGYSQNDGKSGQARYKPY